LRLHQHRFLWSNVSLHSRQLYLVANTPPLMSLLDFSPSAQSPNAAQLISTSHGACMVLSISNPANRNALGPEIYAAGVEALSSAERNVAVRAVIITGAGDNFCAGGDLQRLLRNRALDPQVQADSIDGLNSWIEAIRSFQKPVIAAVEGAAAGAGFSLALACDLVVAAHNALFVMAYTSVGLSPDGGGSWHLAQALPRQAAMQALLLGERLDATRLQQWGLVNVLSAPGAALADALRLAERLTERAPNALASVKDLLNEAGGQSLSQQLSAEREHFVRNLHHANAGEGIHAFLEKRKAIYR
jgi:enoyl-CoA hydratase/carnithine racemase